MSPSLAPLNPRPFARGRRKRAVVYGWLVDDRLLASNVEKEAVYSTSRRGATPWRLSGCLSESLFFSLLDNDPSAGSPTETLLRLLPGSSHCD